MADMNSEAANRDDGINEEAAPVPMSIRFVDTSDNELVFKLKSNTKLKKAMDAYAQRHGLQRNTLRFLFDGDKVLDDHTPASWQMEDGDKVEVHIEQLGGSGEAGGKDDE